MPPRHQDTKPHKFIICSVIVAVFVYSTVFSQPVTTDNAGMIAKNFYFERCQQYNPVSYDELSGSLVETSMSGSQPVYYIYCINKGGFVIVSGDQSVQPVLGYSFTRDYSSAGKPDNFLDWMRHYVREINLARQKNLEADENISREWTRLLSVGPGQLKNYKNQKSVTPMLISQWNQNNWYNEMCPADSGGPGGHVYAGCVACAMGQLMNYYKFPPHGTGSYTYNHPQYGTISADFQNTDYDWNGMPNKITSSNPAIATLLFHCGVSVDMDYGINGSGMWNHKAAYSLRTYFNYGPETQYVFRDSTTLNWDSILIANIDAHKPLYYAGWTQNLSDSSGHAFVCDGYQGVNYYHFNWGWGGSYDGYFYTSALNPGGSDFNYHQELIKDMYPDTMNFIYPESCQTTKILTSTDGTLSDGNGILPYASGLDCRWKIHPVCGSIINLEFDRFDIGTGDTLFIFDGDSSNAPLLATFHSGNVPILSSSSNPTIVVAVSQTMYLEFKTDSTDNLQGWDASYNTKYCLVSRTFTAQSGTVNDGSGACNYQPDAFCIFRLKPPGAGNIVLTFTEFDLATNSLYDYLQVYKDTMITANLIGQFTWQNVPSVLNIPSGYVFLRWVTNASVEAGGWTLNYESWPVGVTDIRDNFGLKLFPNPFNNQVSLEINLPDPAKADIEIHNLTGELSGRMCKPVKKGGEMIDLTPLTEQLPAGVYIIEVTSGAGRSVMKMVKGE